MVKNVCLLIVLTWVSFTFAKPGIVKETMDDAESFKVEKAVEEQDAKRSVAGEKIKKDKKSKFQGKAHGQDASEGSDSEVRYWEYSE